MKLEELGYNEKFEKLRIENKLEAVEKGEIDKSSYGNYLKMEREKAHFESTVEEKRIKDKEFGKLLNNYKKDMKKNKYFD